MNKHEQKILFISDVESMTGRNRLTLRRWWLNDLFPKPILITNRLAWESSTINNWIEKQFNKNNEDK